MIVRPLADGFQLITQPDHAQLARRIMERCVPLAARPRRDAILLATGEHDSGWVETDAAPTVDPAIGAVVPFEIDARELRGGPFRSDAELRAALALVAVVTLRGEVAAAAG